MKKQVINSQVAKNTLQLPDDQTMSADPEAPAKIVWEACDAANAANARREDSLYIELAKCYHAASYINRNREAWHHFCEYTEVEERPIKSGLQILQAVLRLYAGNDPVGKTNASRYKCALATMFENGKSAVELFIALKSGGIDRLSKNAKHLKDPDARPTKDKRLEPLHIETTAKHEGFARAGKKQRIYINVLKDVKFFVTFEEYDFDE